LIRRLLLSAENSPDDYQQRDDDSVFHSLLQVRLKPDTTNVGD
jgi:hypothetical protein